MFKDQVITYHTGHSNLSRDIAENRFLGLEQFLELCVKTRRDQVASEPVDDLWHDALKFTEGYDEFCNEKFGVKIHHKPATVPGQASGYLESRKLAQEIFGSLDESNWPDEERSEWSVGYVK